MSLPPFHYMDGARQIVAAKRKSFEDFYLSFEQSSESVKPNGYHDIWFEWTYAETGRKLSVAFWISGSRSIAGQSSYVEREGGRNFAIKR